MRVSHSVYFAVLLTIGFTGCGKSDVQNSNLVIHDLADVEFSNVDPDVYEFLSRKQRAAINSPNNAVAVGELAMALEMNGFADAALIGYQQAAALSPTDVKWPYFEGLVRASFGDYERALAALDKVLALDKSYTPSWIWKGRFHLELNELHEAAGAFQHALDTDSHTAAIVGLAQVALRDAAADTALKLLQDVGQHSEHPQVAQLIRVANTRLGLSDNTNESRPSTLPGQVGFPDPLSIEKRSYEVSISAKLTRFRNLLVQADGQLAAFELVDTLYEEHPDNKRVVIAKAHRLRLEGDVTNLRTLIDHAYATWPTEINFMLGLAELEIASQKSAEALQLLDQALAIEPENVWGLVQKGIALAQNRQFGEALQSLHRALHLDESAEIHYYIGHAYAELDDFANARCHMQRAVELVPEFAEAAEQLRRLDTIAISNPGVEFEVQNCTRVVEN